MEINTEKLRMQIPQILVSLYKRTFLIKVIFSYVLLLCTDNSIWKSENAVFGLSGLSILNNSQMALKVENNVS